MLRWFHALMPKEEQLLRPVRAAFARPCVAGAEALRAMLEGGEAIERNYQIVMDREQDADDVTREVLIAVRRTFITPFDRGNIRDLITSMDNSIDQMQKTAKRHQAVRGDELHAADEGDGGRDREVRAAGAGRRAAAAARSAPRRCTSATITEQISALEGHADELHDAGHARALSGQASARIRWPSSSATRSTIIWKRSSTASTTSPT